MEIRAGQTTKKATPWEIFQKAFRLCGENSYEAALETFEAAFKTLQSAKKTDSARLKMYERCHEMAIAFAGAKEPGALYKMIDRFKKSAPWFELFYVKYFSKYAFELRDSKLSYHGFAAAAAILNINNCIDEAVACYKKIIEIVAATSESPFKKNIRNYEMILQVYSNAGRHEQALETALEALDEAAKSGRAMSLGAARIHENAGFLCEKLSKDENAENHFKTARDIYIDYNMASKAADIFMLLATRRKLSKTANCEGEADEYARMAFELGEFEFGYISHYSADYYMYMGARYAESADCETSLECFEKALLMYSAINDKNTPGAIKKNFICDNIADSCMAQCVKLAVQSKNADSYSLLVRCAQLIFKYSDGEPFNAAGVYFYFAKWHEVNQNIDEFITFGEKSLELFNEAFSSFQTTYAASLLFSLANAYLALGDKNMGETRLIEFIESFDSMNECFRTSFAADRKWAEAKLAELKAEKATELAK